MTGSKVFLARLNGWALSLVLHGGIAFVAALSVFGVHVSGGSGTAAGGNAGSGLTTKSFAATLRHGDEQVISGEPIGDPPQYEKLSSELTPLEPIAEEPPLTKVPFDALSVGSTELTPPPQITEPNPLNTRPSSQDGRSTKLPPASTGGVGSGRGEASNEGAGGTGGSGGGSSEGNGNGQGSGDGDGPATEVYTPAPAYPSEARRRNIEGTVLVELAIAADGTCAVRRIVESSGFSPLDDAVEKTVSHWKYRSAEADGRPEQMTKRVRFVFKLGQAAH